MLSPDPKLPANSRTLDVKVDPSLCHSDLRVRKCTELAEQIGGKDDNDPQSYAHKAGLLKRMEEVLACRDFEHRDAGTGRAILTTENSLLLKSFLVEGRLEAMAFNTAGDRLAFLKRLHDRSQKLEITVVELDSRSPQDSCTPLVTIPYEGQLSERGASIALSPDNRFLAVALDHAAVIYDISEPAKPISVFECSEPMPKILGGRGRASMQKIQFNHDGTRFVLMRGHPRDEMPSSQISVLDMSGVGTVAGQLHPKVISSNSISGRVTDLCFTPAGDALLYAARIEECIEKPPGLLGRLLGSGKGKFVDRTVSVVEKVPLEWDKSTPALRLVEEEDFPGFTGISCEPCSSKLALEAGGVLLIYDLEGEQPKQRIKFRKGAGSPQGFQLTDSSVISANSKYTYSETYDSYAGEELEKFISGEHCISIYDFSDPAKLRKQAGFSDLSLESVGDRRVFAYHAGEKRLATAAPDSLHDRSRSKIFIFEV